MIAQLIHQNSIFSKNLCSIIDFKDTSKNELVSLFSDSSKYINKNLIAQSNQTTLILNNIDLLNLDYQKKLLFFIENNNFYLKNNMIIKQKIISISSKNINDEIKDGNFLQSLFDRLSVINLKVPPVNLRRDDVLPIVNFT